MKKQGFTEILYYCKLFKIIDGAQKMEINFLENSEDAIRIRKAHEKILRENFPDLYNLQHTLSSSVDSEILFLLNGKSYISCDGNVYQLVPNFDKEMTQKISSKVLEVLNSPSNL